LKNNIDAKGNLMLEKPKSTIENLIGEERRIMLHLIRHFSSFFANETHLGLEKTEEAMIKLINQGYVKIGYHEETQEFTLLIYDRETDKYEEKL
jgi:hypothetical protein